VQDFGAVVGAGIGAIGLLLFGWAMREEMSPEGIGTRESSFWEEVLNHFPVTLICGRQMIASSSNSPCGPG
jgi:hypothetical protein